MAANDKKIIETEFIPRREDILNSIAKGIQRIGYVRVDVFRRECATPEGRAIGVHDGKKLNALKEFLKAEGFKVSMFWWGMSSEGEPDGMTISL